MFDISFAEIVVVFGAAGLLLNKREIVQGSRLVGNSLGRMIGSLQGLKIKIDKNTKGSQMYAVHSSIRDGIRDVSTVGSDLLSVGYSNPVQVPSRYHRPIPNKPDTQIIAQQPTEKVEVNASNTSLDDVEFMKISHIARLILVDDKLNEKEGKSIERTSSGADIVQSTVSSSILNEFYSRSVNQRG